MALFRSHAPPPCDWHLPLGKQLAWAYLVAQWQQGVNVNIACYGLCWWSWNEVMTYTHRFYHREQMSLYTLVQCMRLTLTSSCHVFKLFYILLNVPFQSNFTPDLVSYTVVSVFIWLSMGVRAWFHSQGHFSRCWGVRVEIHMHSRWTHTVHTPSIYDVFDLCVHTRFLMRLHTEKLRMAQGPFILLAGWDGNILDWGGLNSKGKRRGQ